MGDTPPHHVVYGHLSGDANHRTDTMIRMTRLRLSTARSGYYERHTEPEWTALIDTPAAQWVGSARHLIARDGPITEGEWTRVLAGHNPVTGTPFRPTAPTTTHTRTRIDPDSGDVVSFPVIHRPVAGIDVMVSAPKSISLLLALDGPHLTILGAAHATAWRDALALLEREACVVRTPEGRAPGVGFLGAAFTHATNRDGDPHLHTHIVLANQTQIDRDPQWRALDATPLFVHWQRAADAIYSARLRHELTRHLGLTWRRDGPTHIEIAGVSRRAIAHASARMGAVHAHAERFDVHSAHGRRIAQRASRPAKEVFAMDTQRAHWTTQREAWELESLATHLQQAIPRPPHGVRHTHDDAQIIGPAGLTATTHTFTHADLIAAWAHRAHDGARGDEIIARAHAARRHRELVTLEQGRTGVPARYSTHEIIAAEQRIFDAANSAPLPLQPVSAEHVATALAFHAVRLDHEQRYAAEEVAASDRRILCIVGYAGSGKTTALAAGVTALRADGIPVTLAAPSAQAAHVLGQAAGAESMTLHALLARWERGVRVPEGCIIIDEASMADTRTLAHCVDQVMRTHARLVLVGDPQQLPAVGPGGVFAELVRKHGALTLTANHRQHQLWEREALRSVRDGHITHALRTYAAHGRLHHSEDPIAQCVDLWWHQRVADPASHVVMCAYHRVEVAALNREVTQRLDAAGARGPRLEGAATGFAVGDRVRCVVNAPHQGLRNGMHGVIAGAHPPSGGIVICDDAGEHVHISSDYLAHGGLTHAWAITGHAAQGITVDRLIVVAPRDGTLREWGYVVLSRARTEVHLCLDASDTPDHLSQLTTALARSAVRMPASRQLAQARALNPPGRAAPDPPCRHDREVPERVR